jgi:SAM-dependent methyltransferase
MDTPQRTIDTRNAAFWDEACGSEFANIIGATGRDRGSIATFDRAFFANYPYLDRYVRFDELRGRDVLEVGLGYGSVSHRLAERGANFTGLDIARGPVDWIEHRLRLFGLPGRALQGSILAAPFPMRASTPWWRSAATITPATSTARSPRPRGSCGRAAAPSSWSTTRRAMCAG